MKLNKRTAIITGGGSGIGRAIALEFARNGARVVCCGRRADPLNETVKFIEREGGEGLAVQTDVTDQTQVGELVGTTLQRFGTIDVLVNNAGRARSIGAVFEIDPATWWRDVEVNLYGPLLMARAVLPHMMSRGEGIIVNINGGRPLGMSGYASSKAGLTELTRIMSEELKAQGSSVIVLAAYPELIRTEMAEHVAASPAAKKWLPWLIDAIDSGQSQEPEEIAKATIEMIEKATQEQSGSSYGVDLESQIWQKK